MILTCPACQTRYLVDPAKLGARGRAVRCARCGETWTQAPPPDQPKPIEPAAAPPETPTLRRPETPRPLRRNLPALPTRRRSSPALVALLVVAILAGLGVIAVSERERIVARFPVLAPALEAVGLALPDAAAALRIVDAKIEQLRDGDIIVVVVSGAVVNDSDRAVPVPRLRGLFLDAARHEISSWTFAPAGERLLPGESVPFLDRYADPPEGAVDLAVVLDTER